jgi:hypothetical protein
MQMTATRTIGRPAGAVFEFFADATNNPRWQKGMVSCEWVLGEPMEVGFAVPAARPLHGSTRGLDVRREGS